MKSLVSTPSYTSVKPGSRYGFYPQKLPAELDTASARLERWLVQHLDTLRLRFSPNANHDQHFIGNINTLGNKLADSSEAALNRWIQQVHTKLHASGISPSTSIIAFACIREVSRRLLGIAHHAEQLLGGRAILNGAIAEMATGEGKTLTAVLPACTAAMAGIPVHVVTVNDYLAKRDAQLLTAIYQRFGLSVGIIQEDMDEAQRRAAYACDITYCSNKQLAFDFLKDSLHLQGKDDPMSLTLLPLLDQTFKRESLLLRGLNFAIVDEADNIFIDQARTPLILSKIAHLSDSATTEREFYQQALRLSQDFNEGLDFTVDYTLRNISLSPAGRHRMDRLCDKLGGLWSRQRQRKIFIVLALSARYLYQKDRHYVLQDNRVQIIDEFTGRIMVDQSWEYGLQQMIEAKEACELTPRRETLAQISYQDFFKRYWRLGGMTATGQECKSELNLIYGLAVVLIASHQPSRRQVYPARVFATQQEKWQAVLCSVMREHSNHRPVLIGTTSVVASEYLSAKLSDMALPHQVLNAKQHVVEAEIIAKAGDKDRITIATNMAGRGTDIQLGEGVSALGGLHVIVCQYSRSRRTDRQLVGRCARQGDPGSAEIIAALDDDGVLSGLPAPLSFLLRKLSKRPGAVSQRVLVILANLAQLATERSDYRQRMAVMKTDAVYKKRLAFAGKH